MKLAKLSLAAIVVAGLATSSFAADTLADAFKNGKLTGELKAYYFDRDTGDTVVSAEKGDASIFSTGVVLNYITDSFMGFKIGATFQSSHSPFADADAKQVFVSDMYASGAQLSEAYLSYTVNKTSVTAGRMFLSTPLVAGSGSRMVKQAFEGVTIVNTDIANTTLGVGYVDKYQNRTDNAGDIGEFDQFKDGAYTVFAINKSISGLTLTGAFARVLEYKADVADLDVFYAEGKYEGKASTFTYNLAGQYWLNKFSDPQAATLDDSMNAFGLKAGVGIAGFDAYVAYSKISDDKTVNTGATLTDDAKNKLVYGVGSGTDRLYTQSPIISGNYVRGTEAYAIDVAYNVNADTKIGVDYLVTEDPVRGDLSYSAVYGSYTFGGALKGLSVLAQYEKEGKDGNDQEFRFKANYKF